MEDVISKKANASHTHDDRYYTETEIDTKISTINTNITNITNGEIVVKEAEHAESADNATNATNAGHATTADSATSATTAGSATKATQDASGNVITSTYETKSDATAKLAEAKEYTNTKTSGMATTTIVDNKISTHNTSTTAHSDIRDLITGLTTKLNNFLDVDDTTTDQLSEVLTLINNNKGTLESLTSGKVNVSDIADNLTTNNASKVLSAKQGVAIKALIDALDSALDTHTGNTTVHITSTERTNWNAAKTHADTAHAPANAEKNQNAFSNVKVGTVTVAADTTTDTIELVAGSNVTITPDATNDKITISASCVTVDTALSATSTNPVQNKVVNGAINTATQAITANTNSISAHSTAISNLQTAVAEFEEVTSQEIAQLFA